MEQMTRFVDLTGTVLNGIEVLEDARGQGKNPRLKCRCHCGNVFTCVKHNFRKGTVKGCGCQFGNGASAHQLYSTWNGMIDRCYNDKSPGFLLYGNRGIRVCDRWRNSFEAFCSDMGDRPSNKHSIDRIDNDGDYEPENCRWATQVVQINNSRVVRKVKAAGEELSLAQWAKRLGITRERARVLHDQGKLVARINMNHKGAVGVFSVTVTPDELELLHSVDKDDWARKTLLRAARKKQNR